MSTSTKAYDGFGEYEWTSDHPKVIEFASENKDFILEHAPVIYERYQKYKWFIEKNARKHAVPPELAYIAAIESSLDESAISSAGAAGMWQFMKPTARDMGLVVNGKVDERMNWKKSTDAAFKYLKWLAEDQFYGDYELAVIAYNYGIGNTKKVMNKTGAFDAFDVLEYDGLPKESQEYILKFLTYLHLYDYLKQHGQLKSENEYSSDEYSCVTLSSSLRSCALRK